ncbi:hypothetical protein [Paraburkholderia sp. J67]|uniref:hypothetical protein n=1 Tax=Paraburkholderia sp. J67 TaxID=2805435 RepID=UPI002ABDE82F|nr:hypothetical protein [Paraburkholderia sp. J67]
MPEQLAGDALCLCGGLLFAWFTCAFAQLAALAPGWARREPARAKARCARARDTEPPRHVLFAISFALLLTVTPAILALLLMHDAIAVATAELGALAGLWMGARSDLTRFARVIAAVGCGLAMVATSASIAWMLLMPPPSFGTRIALYATAILGALALGAAATAQVFSRDTRAIARKRTPLSHGERALHFMAFVLIVALGGALASVRMGNARSAMEFELSTLGAACVLAIALGVRLMGGARRHPKARIMRAPHDVSKRPAPAGFVVVPDAWLVTACGNAAFEPAAFDTWLSVYEPPAETARLSHHDSRDAPRRRRSRNRQAARSRRPSTTINQP